MELFDGSPRERRLLIGMGIALALAALLFLIFGRGGAEAPAFDDDLQSALRDLQIVETGLASRATVTPDASPKTPFDRGALIRAAQTADLTISRVEPGADDGYTVTFDGAGGDAVLGFLVDIESGTNAVITDLELSAISGERVEARVSLRPGS
jgi:type II secretory pathway component PulM